MHFSASLLVFLCVFLIQNGLCLAQHHPTHSLTLFAKNEEGVSKEVVPKSVENYEKEKLAKLRKNIGRRLITSPTIRRAEFYQSPDDLDKKVRVKREKEGLVIEKVVQNRSGTMYFYQIKFDSGETAYLGADGNNLEVVIKEGDLISVPKKTGPSKRALSKSKAGASRAMELVRNHPTLTDPATGKKRSVELRMMEEKAKSYPNLKWRYEAREIGRSKYRVTQSSREGAGPPLIRTWIVDLTTPEVIPENMAAKELYRGP